MVKAAPSSLLEHIKKLGQTNTFRLSSEFGTHRDKILKTIKKLEEKKLIEFRHGIVKFLKFPEREKRAARKIEVKKSPSSAKAKHKAKATTQRSAKLTEKLKLLGSLQYENKKLRARLLEVEARTKRQHYTKNKKFKEQAEYIQRLEKRIEGLKQKAKAPIIKKIKVPGEFKEKLEPEPKKFLLPKINFGRLNEYIQQLHVPEMLKNF